MPQSHSRLFQSYALLSLLTLVQLSPLSVAKAASDANVIQLMEIGISMNGLSGSVPLEAVINGRDRKSLDEMVLNMPWLLEKVGATDRHISITQLSESEFITPSISDFSGKRLSILAFRAAPGFSGAHGGTVNFHFRAAPSSGGGCRVASIALSNQGDWDRNGYNNFGVSLVGSGRWLKELAIQISDENDSKFVRGVTVTEETSQGEQDTKLSLRALPTGQCPE
jgi:hypothetical protein